MPARYHHRTLPGDLRLAVATVDWAETAAFGIWTPAGSRHDPARLTGVAHFVEHMTFKGTTHRDARTISIEIEGRGGQLNAATSEDQTCYESRGEAELLPLLADIISDLIWNPTFPEHELDLEREVIREEIILYQRVAIGPHQRPARHSLWRPHPFGEPISGTSSHSTRIEHHHLLEHAACHHRRNDIVIAVAGPFEPARSPSSSPPCSPTHPHPAPGHQPVRVEPAPRHRPRNPRNRPDPPRTRLPHPRPSQPDRHALRMLSLILGENSSSRLFQELRESRGLCYHVAADVALFDETGALEITLGLEPDQRDLALECILATTRRPGQQRPRPRTNSPAPNATPSAKAESPSNPPPPTSHWAGESLLHHDRIIEPDEARDQIRRVTAEEVARAAANTFRRDHHASAEISPADSNN